MTTLQQSRELGEQQMTICFANAQERDPEFSSKAKRAILQHLRVVGQCSGEELTDIAKAHGAVPHSDRAFGGVFLSLLHAGNIRCIRSDLPRRRGHGTSGGKLWGYCYG